LVSLSKILVKQLKVKINFERIEHRFPLSSEIQRPLRGLLTIGPNEALVQNLPLSRQRCFIDKLKSRKGIKIADIYRILILRYLTAPDIF
jgi:hypothetical protein